MEPKQNKYAGKSCKIVPAITWAGGTGCSCWEVEHLAVMGAPTPPRVPQCKRRPWTGHAMQEELNCGVHALFLK